MSGKYPTVSWKELVGVLKKLGYVKISQKGSHVKMRYKNGKSMIIIPAHKAISIGVLKLAIKEAMKITGKNEKEIIELLKNG